MSRTKMSRMKRSIPTVGALAALAMAVGGVRMGVAAPEGDEQALPQAEILAVKFHADWCGTCEAIAPRLEDLKEQFTDEPLLHVKLDFTNDFTKRQAAFLANELGINQAWDAGAGKTGFVLLVDAESRDVVGRLTVRDDASEMRRAMKSAIESAANGEESEHPKSEHPTSEHPGSEHPG